MMHVRSFYLFVCETLIWLVKCFEIIESMWFAFPQIFSQVIHVNHLRVNELFAWV